MAGRASESAGMGITYEGTDAGTFIDPFAADAEHDEDVYDVPFVPAAEPLSSGGGRGAASSLGGPSGSSASASASASSSGGAAGGGLGSFDIAHAIHAGSLAMPAFGGAFATGAANADKRYLAHERRSLWGQASYNVGYSYFGGLALGGIYGVLAGVRASPNARPRVLLNAMLNGAGKHGAKSGNAAGVLAMVYTVLERNLEDAEVDKLPGWANNAIGMDVFPRSRVDGLIPAVSALGTGVLFTLPRALTMKGVDRVHVSLVKRLAVCAVGGAATLAGVGVLAAVGPLVFGHRSPFRFA